MLIEAIRGLARTLGACLIAWTRTDPPEPWLGSTRKLAESPIRRELAKILGFPLAAYFGGLIPVRSNQGANSTKAASDSADRRFELLESLGRSPEEYERVIAFGAAGCWRKLSTKGKQGHSDLARLMKEEDNRYALQSIADLTDTDPDWLAHIDSETRFTVAFFVSLRETASPAQHAEFPPTLRDALLSNGGEYRNSYPIRLGRLIAGGKSDLGYQFRQVFQAPEKSSLFPSRVMQLPGPGWSGFSALETDDGPPSMLRLLFTLSLIAAEEADKSDKTRVRFSSRNIRSTMRIPDTGAKKAVARFFSHSTNRGYKDAFYAATRLAGLEKLPGGGRTSVSHRHNHAQHAKTRNRTGSALKYLGTSAVKLVHVSESHGSICQAARGFA